MKTIPFAKRVLCAAMLSGAFVSANAVVIHNLGAVAIGVPQPFQALTSGPALTEISDIFTFTLPANGGSGYSVADFTLFAPAYASFLTTMALFKDPDGSVAATSLASLDEVMVASSVVPGGASLTMTFGPSAGGSMFLVIGGLTNGSAGGAYIGAISASAVTAVPEPENYAMLLAGLGVMGAIAIRRNKSKSD